MLPRLSPFPDSAAPPTPLAAAREGRSAPLPSQGADRLTEAALTDDAGDWGDQFEADLAAEVVPLGGASRLTVERSYLSHVEAGQISPNDIRHLETRSFAVPLSGGNGSGRSAPSGGADRIFHPAVDMPFEPDDADVPNIIKRSPSVQIDWFAPAPNFGPSEGMLGSCVLICLFFLLVGLASYLALRFAGAV